MEGKTLARIGAAAFAGIAVTAAAIEATREERPVVPVTVEVSTGPVDPMTEALARCRFMGEAATRDSDCLKTWDENRRRFLGTSSPSQGR